MARPQQTRKKKQKRDIPKHAQAHITATFNNTICTITETNGNTIIWGSTGTAGYKGTRQSTPFAATTAMQRVADQARELGVQSIDVVIKGIGIGRDSAIRALKAAGLEITSIADITPIPHNGCRPKRKRRV